MLYKILQNKDDTIKFINNVNNMCFDKDNKFIDKDTYLNIKKQNSLESYFIINKFYTMRQGLFPSNRKLRKIYIDDFLKIPIIKFLQTEKIEISNIDALEIIKKYNDSDNLILCDPPYMATCNDFYTNKDMSIYEWLYNNKNILKNCIFVLENHFIIKLLFNDVKLKETYVKKYNGMKKKTVDHILVFCNQNETT